MFIFAIVLEMKITYQHDEAVVFFQKWASGYPKNLGCGFGWLLH